ncbi:MAG: hypothetical protein D6710_01910 [Nitrospirae bacterium]|nr:MAG: hypothetical protein D6710_01910 [Nitrospirota bacterium]
MALKWIEGWQLCRTTLELERKYVLTSSTGSYGFGNLTPHNTNLSPDDYYIQGSSSAAELTTPPLDPTGQSEWYVGFALYLGSHPGTTSFTQNLVAIGTGTADTPEVLSDANTQVSLTVIPGGGGQSATKYALAVNLGTSTVLADTTTDPVFGVLEPNQWYYIELGVTIDNTTGSYELRINETPAVSGSGDTQNVLSTSNADRVKFVLDNQGGSIARRIDDIYILDGTTDATASGAGVPNNTFLGESFVEALYPVDDGAVTTFSITPGATGTHADQVNDSNGLAPDDDNSYVWVSGAGSTSPQMNLREIFKLSNLQTITGDIKGIMLNVTAKHTTAVTGDNMKAYLLSGTTPVETTWFTIPTNSTSYDVYSLVYEYNPISTGAWTQDDLSGNPNPPIEMGLKGLV